MLSIYGDEGSPGCLTHTLVATVALFETAAVGNAIYLGWF